MKRWACLLTTCGLMAALPWAMASKRRAVAMRLRRARRAPQTPWNRGCSGSTRTTTAS